MSDEQYDYSIFGDQPTVPVHVLSLPKPRRDKVQSFFGQWLINIHLGMSEEFTISLDQVQLSELEKGVPSLMEMYLREQITDQIEGRIKRLKHAMMMYSILLFENCGPFEDMADRKGVSEVLQLCRGMLDDAIHAKASTTLLSALRTAHSLVAEPKEKSMTQMVANNMPKMGEAANMKTGEKTTDELATEEKVTVEAFASKMGGIAHGIAGHPGG